MSRAVLLGLVWVGVSGCGRLGFDGLGRGTDAATSISDGPATGGDGMARGEDAAGHDAAPACETFGAWSKPVREVAVSSPSTDWGPSISRDSLELVFASNRSGEFRIHRASRAARDQPWGAPDLVPEIPGPAQDPSLSADGLEIYWGASGGIGYATRASLAAAWTNLEMLVADTAAYGGAGGPDISRDGFSLVFTATQRSDALWHEYISTRSTLGAPFGDGQLLAGVTSPGGDAFGSVRGDGLEVIYANQPSSGATDLFTATRGSSADPFGVATAALVLDSDANDGDGDLSDDGRTLTFASDRAGADGQDIFTSTRSCER